MFSPTGLILAAQPQVFASPVRVFFLDPKSMVLLVAVRYFSNQLVNAVPLVPDVCVGPVPEILTLDVTEPEDGCVADVG